MSKFREYLKNTAGDPNAVVNDAYTHLTTNYRNITKVQRPDTPNIIVTIETMKLGNRVTGSVRQYGADQGWHTSPLNAFLSGPVADLKAYFSDKSQSVKPLQSWVERALNDHVNHFYR